MPQFSLTYLWDRGSRVFMVTNSWLALSSLVANEDSPRRVTLNLLKLKVFKLEWSGRVRCQLKYRSRHDRRAKLRGESSLILMSLQSGQVKSTSHLFVRVVIYPNYNLIKFGQSSSSRTFTEDSLKYRIATILRLQFINCIPIMNLNFAYLHSELDHSKNLTMWLRLPRDHERVFATTIISVESRVRILVPWKTHRVERLMHVRSIEAQSYHVDVVWKFGDWGAGSNVVLII
ncbi:hypothetical protein TNCV_2819981 [Trichonephila clavipes]|nr:hypothetical protein TNCV_2819981 [Trichonephila clavipes]